MSGSLVISTLNILDPTLSSIVFPASASATYFLTCHLVIQFNGKKNKIQKIKNLSACCEDRILRSMTESVQKTRELPALPLLFQKAAPQPCWIQPQTDMSQDRSQALLMQRLVVLVWGGYVKYHITTMYVIHISQFYWEAHTGDRFLVMWQSVADRLLRLLFVKTLSENHTFSGIFSESHGAKEAPFLIFLSTTNSMVPLFSQ